MELYIYYIVIYIIIYIHDNGFNGFAGMASSIIAYQGCKCTIWPINTCRLANRFFDGYGYPKFWMSYKIYPRPHHYIILTVNDRCRGNQVDELFWLEACLKAFLFSQIQWKWQTSRRWVSMRCCKSTSQTEIGLRPYLKVFDWLLFVRVDFFYPWTGGTLDWCEPLLRLSSSSGVRVSPGSRRYKPTPSRRAATISQSSTIPTTCLEAVVGFRNNISYSYIGFSLGSNMFKRTVYCQGGMFLRVWGRSETPAPQQVLIVKPPEIKALLNCATVLLP